MTVNGGVWPPCSTPADPGRSSARTKPSPRRCAARGAAREARGRGTAGVRRGAGLGDIGHGIQSTVEPLGFSVVRDFVGHGVGRRFHEDPQVLHYGVAGTGSRLHAGLTFTIEPMINAGAPDIEIL